MGTEKKKMWPQQIRGKRAIRCILTKTEARYRACGGVGGGKNERKIKEGIIY